MIHRYSDYRPLAGLEVTFLTAVAETFRAWGAKPPRFAPPWQAESGACKRQQLNREEENL